MDNINATEPLDKQRKLFQLSTVFSPSAPINKQDLFAGRTEQLNDVITAINQRGQHVVMYGERGVGKTSLASILAEFIGRAGLQRIQSGTINCDATDDFSTLWRKIFREMSYPIERSGIGFNAENTREHINMAQVLNSHMQTEEVTPDDVRFVLSRIGRATIIIDEIDRIQDRRTTTLLADTIKTLSDHSAETTLVLVGVADSVDQLIQEHRSVERALVQIHMPRMSPEELYEILDKGTHAVGMKISEQSRERIAWLSRGLPHYTHLLGLNASMNAVNHDRSSVDISDVRAALKPAVDKAQQSIRRAYHSATNSPRVENLFAEVLLACALAPSDDLGYFAASDVRRPLSEIMKKPYDIPAFSRHLNDFCLPVKGEVLQKVGTPRKYRFRFVNPLLQPFVVIDGLAKNLIPSSLLKDFGMEVIPD